jgi:uncharacterized protein (DUF2249 family)
MEREFKELDVRPILANGGDPFGEIMAAVEGLAPGQGLKLLAPFKPQPLFTVMERRGFLHQLRELDDGDFEVRFMPEASRILASDDVADDDDWPEPSRTFDFSELDPPQPMVRILSELETMSPGDVLFAVLAREPLFLFPELTKRGHKWAGNYDRSGSAFRIMIRRGG